MARKDVYGTQRLRFGDYRRAALLLLTLTLLQAPIVWANEMIAVDDFASGTEDSSITVVPAQNDSFDGVGGGAFGYSLTADSPANGTATAGSTGVVTYQPAPHFSGVDTFSYTIRTTDPDCDPSDGDICEATARVTVNVRPVADAPMLSAASVTGVEDAAVPLSLGATTADVDGSETLTATIGNLPAGASISSGVESSPGAWTLPVNALSSAAFIPAPDYNGTVTLNFSVSVRDQAGVLSPDLPDSTASDTTLFTVTVSAVDDRPRQDGPVPTLVGQEDQTLTGDLSGVFVDVDSPLDLRITEFSGAVIEAASISGDQLSVVPIANGNGSGTVRVRAFAPGGAPLVVAVPVEFAPVNDIPALGVLLPGVTTAEDSGTVTVSLAGAFVDADADTNGDSFTYAASVSGAALFDSVNIAGDSASFMLRPNANGTANVEIVATDSGGATARQTFSIAVGAVNDAPFVDNEIPSEVIDEDDANRTFNLTTVFDDVDIDTNGDVLSFSVVSVSNPDLFDSVAVGSGGILELDLAPDANGGATIVVEASDGELTVTESFQVTVTAVNDIPIANDDVFVILEDQADVVFDVLANDYLAEGPSIVLEAGKAGFSESTDFFVYLDENGDPVGGPNGEVNIVPGGIQYVPKPNFFGEDTFSYRIQDEDGAGDVSNFATVTITVTPVNDPPEGQSTRTFPMFENESITVSAADGLVSGVYDIDDARIDPDTGNPVGGTYSVVLETNPSGGGAFSISPDGSFTYAPLPDWTGVSVFTYRVQDQALSSIGIYQARIVVSGVPDPVAPPAPGEVAVSFGIANTPLEQATGVTPNVLVVMDDSGSMDWDITSFSPGNEGVFTLDNSAARGFGRNRTLYQYLWALPGNTFGSRSNGGRSLPTEEALNAFTDTDNNQYGVWRARNSQFNVMYYNPQTRYEPWVGFDTQDIAFADADPTAIRLNPLDPTSTLNILNDFTYLADNVPQWDNNGGLRDILVTTYIPRYYATSVPGIPEWDDPRLLIEIRPGAGPLPGGAFPGGVNRFDCGGDGDTASCSYAEEIQNFANWFQYYRKREFAAKGAVAAVLENVDDLRVGYENLNGPQQFEIEQMNPLISEGAKKDLMDTLFAANSFGGTPLRQALRDAGELYRCTRGDRDCPVLPAPDGTCQQNFTLLFSDGFWNNAAGVTGNADNDGAGPWDGGRYADTINGTLADTAMFYYETDLHPGLEDQVAPNAKDRSGRVAGVFADGERMHQHMKTFTIAFGVVGTIDPQTVPKDPTVPFSWTDPFAATQTKIDDMLHAAVNGRGEFLNATDPNQLRRAVEDAFEEFSNAQSSVSAAAFNSSSLRDGTFLFRGSYDLSDNTGELTASLVTVDGVVSATPLWSAADQLNPSTLAPAARRLVTFDANSRDGIIFNFADLTPAQQIGVNEPVFNWIRGDRSLEVNQGGGLRDRSPNRLLGDIVNSSPVFVGGPRAINRDQAPYPTGPGQLYSEFVDDNRTRPGLVYVGANDGMLHGFDAQTGNELFGYVPNKLFESNARFASELRDLSDPFYAHRYYVDLTPRLNDAYISVASAAKEWRTILVGGLGAGGKGYYALDVTDPADFATNTAAANTVLWEFTDDDDPYPIQSDGTPLGGSIGAVTDPDGLPVKDLGYALSLPTIAMSNVVDTDGDNEWIAIFGNGQNSTSGIAKLYALFVDAGIDGWGADEVVKIDTGFGVPVTEPAEWIGYPNGLGSPTAVDRDLNGTVDLVYAGDKLGNLYRFDLSSDDPDQWTSVLLFTATYGTGPNQRRQAILERPLVTPHPTQPGFLVIFGTGSYFTDDDASNEDIQSIYGIWDPATSRSPFTAAPDSKATRLIEQTITNAVDDGVTPAQTRRVVTSQDVNYTSETGTPGVYGWYIDLDMPRAETTVSGVVNTDQSGRAPPEPQFPGERAVRRFVLRNGNILTTTVLPTSGEASCFGTRPGSLLIFNAANGGNATSPVVDFNRDGVVDDGDLVEVDGSLYAGGLLLNQDQLDGTLVDLSTLGGDGDTDFLFLSGGTDTVSYRIEELIGDRTGRLSWREVQND